MNLLSLYFFKVALVITIHIFCVQSLLCFIASIIVQIILRLCLSILNVRANNFIIEALAGCEEKNNDVYTRLNRFTFVS